jgi:exodeoxyribonuclease VII small subunit
MTNEKNNLQNALKQLEAIVNDLSNKDVDVESGLEKFKVGVSLIKFCRGQLKQAENEFQKLKAELEVEDNVEMEEPDENLEELPQIETKDGRTRT